MDEVFNVIVVGAGPGGAQCARELSKKGWRAALIEKNKEIGEPNFSTAGTTDYLLKEFNLPQSVVGTSWDKVSIISSFNEYNWKFDKVRGYVLKFDELKKFLTKEALDNGCQVYSGSAVKGPLLENGKVVGVEFEDSAKDGLRGKIIVDASGALAVIASKIGLRKQVLAYPAEGLEYIMNNVNFPLKNTLYTYLGRKYVPHGYGWIFPMGEHTAKVGIAIYEAEKYKKDNKSMLDMLKEFIEKLPWLKGATYDELHGGSIYVTGGIKNYVHDNVLAVGDAGAQINPLAGEGIRHAMRAGNMAAENIDKALKDNDLSKLKSYEKEWKKYTGIKWKLSEIIEQLIYHRLNDKQQDRFLYYCRNFSSQDVFDIMFEYKFRIFFKALKPISPLSLIRSFKT